eukprot:CAMPEP_0172451484 /NCGR_PEP_ID=MMETSP1065-20121228/9520_1 /TAXON_ID=265537 /ORGANISM="Amphiprora paludosa, Strain CCMP125" /LENGTH=323 /DNA_ID=CAMNT_0013203447 /DNA_START=67 /DNA_END=1038 /DNA_ORIENTATION=+
MYESRIFIVLNGLDPEIRSKLTLDNAAFSAHLFPDETSGPPSFSGGLDTAETRTDDYFLLEGCPGAKEIGLKSRGNSKLGSSKSTLELKTTISKQTVSRTARPASVSTKNNQHSEEASEEALAYWIKSRHKGKFGGRSTTNPHVLMGFLQEHCSSPQQREAVNAVTTWLGEGRMEVQELPTVQTMKCRRNAYIDHGDICLEEADVEFQVMREGSGTDNKRNSDQDQIVVAKSFSAESTTDSPKLQSIACHWKERFTQAMKAVVAGTSDQSNHSSHVLVASYPEMVLRVPELLSERNEMKDTETSKKEEGDEPAPKKIKHQNYG